MINCHVSPLGFSFMPSGSKLVGVLGYVITQNLIAQVDRLKSGRN